MSPDWLRVDLSVVEAVGTDSALILSLIQFRSYESGCWEATVEVMASSVHLSVKRVRSALTSLRAAELVASERGDRFRPTLTWTPVSAGHAVNADLGITRMPERESPVMTETAITSYEEVEEETPLPPKGEESLFDAPAPRAPKRLRAVPSEADLDAEFVGFWKAYPRKVSKKAARLRYAKVRRTATLEQIAGALRAALPALQERDPQFVPHPASWLNAEPWQDGPAEVVPSPMTNAELCSGRPLTPQRQAEVDAWNAQARTYPVTR